MYFCNGLSFHCAHSHLEMQLYDIMIVSVMVLDAYTISDTGPIPPKMADTDLIIWYRCIPIICILFLLNVVLFKIYKPYWMPNSVPEARQFFRWERAPLNKRSTISLNKSTKNPLF